MICHPTIGRQHEPVTSHQKRRHRVDLLEEKHCSYISCYTMSEYGV
jgi:hypothetical protein